MIVIIVTQCYVQQLDSSHALISTLKEQAEILTLPLVSFPGGVYVLGPCYTFCIPVIVDHNNLHHEA